MFIYIRKFSARGPAARSPRGCWSAGGFEKAAKQNRNISKNDINRTYFELFRIIHRNNRNSKKPLEISLEDREKALE